MTWIQGNPQLHRDATATQVFNAPLDAFLAAKTPGDIFPQSRPMLPQKILLIGLAKTVNYKPD